MLPSSVSPSDFQGRSLKDTDCHAFICNSSAGLHCGICSVKQSIIFTALLNYIDKTKAVCLMVQHYPQRAKELCVCVCSSVSGYYFLFVRMSVYFSKGKYWVKCVCECSEANIKVFPNNINIKTQILVDGYIIYNADVVVCHRNCSLEYNPQRQKMQKKNLTLFWQ